MRGPYLWSRLLVTAVSVVLIQFSLAFQPHVSRSLERLPALWSPRHRPSVYGIYNGRVPPLLKDAGPRRPALAVASGGLRDRFSRWRWLQRLLDEETAAADTNRILYQALNDFLLNPGEEDEETPVLTPARRERLELLLESVSDGRVEALTEDATGKTNSAGVLGQLEGLLPDPDDEEDAHTGLWDIVMELHGREAVRINEQNRRTEWKTRCLVARILIFYDFLSRDVFEP